jgi:hypothetical protein
VAAVVHTAKPGVGTPSRRSLVNSSNRTWRGKGENEMYQSEQTHSQDTMQRAVLNFDEEKSMVPGKCMVPEQGLCQLQPLTSVGRILRRSLNGSG